MIDLAFTVTGVEATPHAAVPQLTFQLRVEERNAQQPTDIQSIQLRCQLRIEPTRRIYEGEDPRLLVDLFGEPAGWGRTMHSLLWTHVQTTVNSFMGAADFALPVACSFDFNVAATKYFAALEHGEIPLLLLFSGSVFYRTGDARLQIAPIAWDQEAAYRLPVSVWREMMDHYYPGTVWLSLDREVFDRLAAYQSRQGLPNWRQAIDALLAHEHEQVHERVLT
jgi:hypothetical protein